DPPSLRTDPPRAAGLLAFVGRPRSIASHPRLPPEAPCAASQIPVPLPESSLPCRPTRVVPGRPASASDLLPTLFAAPWRSASPAIARFARPPTVSSRRRRRLRLSQARLRR